MEIGGVFTWENYPNATDNKIKRRWFVYLGETKEDPFVKDDWKIYIIAITTTTQEQYYLDGGERHNNPHIKFKQEYGFGFASECILDLSFQPESSSRSIFLQNIRNGNIKQKGVISAEILKQIYDKICLSRAYSYKIKQDIHQNLNANGIKGLSQPPLRRRRDRFYG
jgi:hypothetical protein